MDGTRLFDVPAAAEYLGITERTLRHWVFTNAITYIKAGRLLRFSQDDLDAFLAERRVEATTTPAAISGRSS